MSAKAVVAGRRSLWQELRRNKMLFLLLLPGTLYFLINNYLPMLGLVLAFKQVNFRGKGPFFSPWNGFKNFEFLFSSPDAYTITRNTVGYNLAFIVLGTVAAVLCAALLNEIRKRVLVAFFQSILFFPYILSFVVVGYLVFGLLSMESGYMNHHILPALGIDPVEWYNEPKYWPFILLIVYIWKNIGYGTVIYLAAMIGIDTTYYEAALIDGASKWKQFRHITLPSITPLISVLTLLSIGKIFFADFGLFFQVPLQAGMLYPTTLVIDTHVYNVMRLHNDIGMAAAVGFYQASVGFVLVLVSNFIARKINKDNAIY